MSSDLDRLCSEYEAFCIANQFPAYLSADELQYELLTRDDNSLKPQIIWLEEFMIRWQIAQLCADKVQS